MTSRLETADRIMRGLQRDARLNKGKTPTLEMAQRLADSVGVILLTDEGLYLYEQGIVFVDSLLDSGKIVPIIHEIAHFQCASPYRRGLPDFGMTSGDSNGPIFEVLNDVAADAEEEEASMLGILHERSLGCDFFETLGMHSWALEGLDPRFYRDAFLWEHPEVATKTISSLLRKELITGRGVPRLRVNTQPDPWEGS